VSRDDDTLRHARVSHLLMSSCFTCDNGIKYIRGWSAHRKALGLCDMFEWVHAKVLGIMLSIV